MATNIKIPICSSNEHTGGIQYRGIETNDWCIVTRAPCISTGSILPMRIIVEDQIGITDRGTVTGGTSIGLPIDACFQMGADFDGDAITVIPVHSDRGVLECMNWKHTSWRSMEDTQDSQHHSRIPLGHLIPREAMFPENSADFI